MSTDMNIFAQKAIELGAAMKTPFNTASEGTPFMVLPQGMKTESLKTFFPPARIEQSVEMLEVGSFCDYVNRFKQPDTLIFADVSETGANFEAVIDYHRAPEQKPVEAAEGAEKDLTIHRVAAPAYCSHRVRFSLIETPEWKVWKSANRQVMTQVEFATWLEDNLKLFITPKGAELLELVRSLHGHKNARFDTSVRLDNGAYSASYQEEIEVKAGHQQTSGKMDLPAVLEAGIPVFQGGELYKVSARLKTRIDERRLKIFFETIALHEIVRDSIMSATKQIADKTGILPLLGSI